MQVSVINRSHNSLPEYKTPLSAGLDLAAFLPEGSISIPPFGRQAVPTGLFVEIPEGYEAQVRPRSGLALNFGVTVLNSPGTVDADYRGEIKVILINLSQSPFTIHNGDRIAQLIFAAVAQVQWVETDQLSQTLRGGGGFGHTGLTNTNTIV